MEAQSAQAYEGEALSLERAALAAAAAAALLAACGGGGDNSASVSGLPGSGGAAPPATAAAMPPTEKDAARFLAQASLGASSPQQVSALQAQGLEAWLHQQFNLPTQLHVAYLESQRGRDDKPGEAPRVSEEMSYEALWQQWLKGEDQLRARMVWALLQIMVISNIAPDIRAHAMSSYLDMLGRNAFGNYRQLLEEVTLHPAMGYYLNMVESEKEDDKAGTHPNENYAREVLQLFSIGLVKLNLDGSTQLDAAGQPIATYIEEVVKGFARAFSGWSYGLQDNTRANTFHSYDPNVDGQWVTPMKAWPMWHSTAAKPLLDGRVLPAGQTAEKDMADALDNIFKHPNVGPFIGRQLIQRLVTSNPSADYIRRVATVFNETGRVCVVICVPWSARCCWMPKRVRTLKKPLPQRPRAWASSASRCCVLRPPCAHSVQAVQMDVTISTTSTAPTMPWARAHCSRPRSSTFIRPTTALPARWPQQAWWRRNFRSPARPRWSVRSTFLPSCSAAAVMARASRAWCSTLRRWRRWRPTRRRWWIASTCCSLRAAWAPPPETGCAIW